MAQKLKIALAHDYLNQWGGGERVMSIFHDLYPEADIHTITYDPDKIKEFSGEKIKTSFIQKLPFGISKYKWYLALMPWAVESMDFRGYDLVLSDSSGFIKGIKVPKNCLHICYIHTSTRYLTVDGDYFEYTVPKFLHPLVPPLFKYLKRKDYQEAQTPDYYIANSKVTAERVKTYYKREVDTVIFPPADTSRFFRKAEDGVGDYYLLAGRLVPYKRADLAIAACNKLGRRLVIIGAGPDEEALRAMAGPTIEFRGKVSDAELREAYANCRAFLFPPLEDAGMTPLEAMSCGRPVIAYGKGGVLESVVDGKSGLFFAEQTPEVLAATIERFETMSFDTKEIIKHAEQFSAENFKAKIKKVVDEQLVAWKKNN